MNAERCQYQLRSSKGYLVPALRFFDFLGELIFSKKPKQIEINSILILQPANFGDVVVTLPTIKGFKEAFPLASVDVLVKQDLLGLINTVKGKSEYISKVWTLKEDWMPTDGKFGLKSFYSFLKTDLFKELKAKKYDLIVDVHGDPRNILLMYLLKGKLRVGFPIRGLGFLLTHKASFKENTHIIDRYFETVHCFSTIDIPHELGFPARVKPTNKICIHPGTGLRIKQWSDTGWAKVADHFIDKGYKVVFTGTEFERDLISKILSNMEFRNLAQVSIIKKLPTLLLHLIDCNLFISPDTGPAHLAHAMSAPQLQLFGPSRGDRWGYSNVCSVECECMNELECKRGFEDRCMLKLDPSIVISESEEVLNG